MIIGDNGILTQTEKAKELTEQAEKDVQQEMSSLADEIKTLIGDTPMKVLVNSGEDGSVKAPIAYLQGTIDWGDGTVEEITDAEYNETERYPAVHTHTYKNKNTEYIIKIKGKAYKIGSEDNNKILKVLDWGELSAYDINLYKSTNLTEIASPREKSFENVTYFGYAFAYCTSLTSIPSDLFANCPNVTSFYLTFANCTRLTSIPSDLFANCSKVTDFEFTFYECTSLTGNSIRLWEDTNRAVYGITENSGGQGCYYGCENLNDYNTIPEYWKKKMEK